MPKKYKITDDMYPRMPDTSKLPKIPDLPEYHLTTESRLWDKSKSKSKPKPKHHSANDGSFIDKRRSL